jgi:hypothetical protein
VNAKIANSSFVIVGAMIKLLLKILLSFVVGATALTAVISAILGFIVFSERLDGWPFVIVFFLFLIFAATLTGQSILEKK